MKVKYKAQKRTRVKHTFLGFTCKKSNWWYHRYTNQWKDHSGPSYESDGKGYCSHQECHSVRAFRRKLKECPKGAEFILVSRYRGHNVYGKGSKE